MTTVNDVFACIAERLKVGPGPNLPPLLNEAFPGLLFELHLAITTDLAETEADFARRYGPGDAFSFRLHNYAHGKLLAAQLYWALLRQRPDLSRHAGSRFGVGERLCLVVHLSNLRLPVAAAAVA